MNRTLVPVYFASRLTLLGAVFITAVFCGNSSSKAGSLGAVLATFPFQSTDFLADPSQPYMYVSTKTNALEVVNTNTLAVVTTIPLRGAPLGMALSPDGRTLYVADSTNRSVDLISTSTLTVSNSLATTGEVTDVAVGLNNRLFVLDANNGGSVQQIDATTGAVVGPTVTGISAVSLSGDLKISPDRKTLYYSDHGISLGHIEAYDVSTTSPSLLREVSPGSDGQGTALSTSGALIADPCGSPDSITLYNASNFSSLDAFNLGNGRPNNVAFNPSGTVTYVAELEGNFGQIDVFDNGTFADVAHFSTLGETAAMQVDPTGRKLFVAFNDPASKSTVVYDTGVPEPATSLLLLLGGAVAMTRVRRRDRSTRTAPPFPRC